MSRRTWTVIVLALMIGLAGAHSQEIGEAFGVRGGIGTDITFGGVAFGGGVNHIFQEQIEIGLMAYYGKFEETTEDFHTYNETTEITVIMLYAEYLYGYVMEQSGWYFAGGAGVTYLGVYWEESSPTDTSLGPPLAGGGSKQDFEGSIGGLAVIAGAGYSFYTGLDLRFEIPLVIAFGDTGGASTVIPLFAITAGYRF